MLYMTFKTTCFVLAVITSVFFISCGGPDKRGERVFPNADGGFVKEYLDQSGQIIKRISFNADSLKSGCYEIFDQEGDLLVQANFFEGLHDGLYLSFSSGVTPGELRFFSKGLKDGFQLITGPNGAISIEYYSRGLRHGGKLQMDSTGNLKKVWVYFANQILGEIEWLDEKRYNVSGELYFFDVLPHPGAVVELSPVIRVLGVPGFRSKVSVAIQDDSLGVYLQKVEPVDFSNNMLSWALSISHLRRYLWI